MRCPGRRGGPTQHVELQLAEREGRDGSFLHPGTSRQQLFENRRRRVGIAALTGHVGECQEEAGLVHGATGDIARISVPIGTQARVLLWSPILVAHVRNDNGATQERKPCADPACEVDHEALRTDVDLRVVVRSI